MPAPLVVNDVCRFAVIQELFGRQVVNILDMKMTTNGIDPINRPNAAADQAKIIAKEWKARLLGGQVNALTLKAVRWVDLDSLGGSTGAFLGSPDVTLPAAGLIAQQALTPSTSVLVTKQTEGARGQKTGRMYFAGTGETDNDPANQRMLKPDWVPLLQGAFDGFLSAINQEGGISGEVYDSDLHVVHTKPLVEATSSLVTKLAVQQLLATQRRRQRG
jgi:hypothetical protein